MFSVMTADDGFPPHWGKPPPRSSEPLMVLARRNWIDANERADAAFREANTDRNRKARKACNSGAACLKTVAATRYDPYIDDN